MKVGNAHDLKLRRKNVFLMQSISKIYEENSPTYPSVDVRQNK